MIMDALRSQLQGVLKDIPVIDAPMLKHDSLAQSVRWFVETKSRHPEDIGIDFSKIQHGIDKIRWE